MKTFSRRQLLTSGIAALAGLAISRSVGRRYGLIPPDSGGLFGLGETLTYASQRLLTKHSLAREFPRNQISQHPFANEIAPPADAFKRMQAGGFRDWKIAVDGTVAHPLSLSLSDLHRFPMRSQITEVSCEEGWSYIAEWIGTPLSSLLLEAGILPQTRYIVYRGIEPWWWESIDMADALHPQTIVTLGMNGSDLPVPFGGPVRLRVPRQIGFKSIKFLVRITATDSLRGFGKGLGSASPEAGYAWWGGM